jgi:hypothetical protein
VRLEGSIAIGCVVAPEVLLAGLAALLIIGVHWIVATGVLFR